MLLGADPVFFSLAAWFRFVDPHKQSYAVSYVQAWRDFVDRQSEAPMLPGSSTSAASPSTTKPSLVDALKSRPLRALAAAFGALLLLSLLSAAAGGPGQSHLQSAMKLGTYWDAKAESYNDALDNAPAGKFGIEPQWTKDASNGFLYPPDIQPAHLNRYRRANATFVSLVRNNEREWRSRLTPHSTLTGRGADFFAALPGTSRSQQHKRQYGAGGWRMRSCYTQDSPHAHPKSI